MQDLSLIELREKYDAAMEINKKLVDECWAKVEKMKPMEYILKEVNKTIDSKLNVLQQSVTELGSSVSARFLKLYKEELWEEGYFGPVEGDQFLTMKDYMMSHISKAHTENQRLEDETK